MTKFTAASTHLAFALSAMMFLAACAKSDGTKASEPISCELAGSSFGIVGGQVLGPKNELSSSTVMILNKNIDDEVSLCTGTLIDNDKVLTAGHCANPGGRSLILFTNNLECATKAPEQSTREVIARVVHPSYSNAAQTSSAANDLSILQFKGGLPENFKVRALPPQEIHPSAKAIVVAAGYGITTEKGEDSGTLRFTTADISRLSTSYVRAFDEKKIALKKTLVLEQKTNGVCQGDSGGPLYIKDGDTMTLIGVTSMVTDNTAKSLGDMMEKRYCHGVSLFVDIRQHMDWITQQMNELSVKQRVQ